MDCLRTGRGLDMDIVVDNGADTSGQTATDSRTLPVHHANAKRAATEMMRDQCTDTMPDDARTLPSRQATAARLLLGQFTGHCADINRILSRCCPNAARQLTGCHTNAALNVAPDAARKLHRTSAGIVPDVARQLPG